MVKKSKVISGLLVASIISSTSLSSILTNSVKARNSRPVVVNNDSNSLKNKTNKNQSKDTNFSDKKPQSNSSNSNNTGSTPNTSKDPDKNKVVEDNFSNTVDTIIETINSDDSIDIDTISKLAYYASYSDGFIKEFEDKFPNLDPLRKLSNIDKDSKNYLDVKSSSFQSVKEPLNNSNSVPSIYNEQNICFTLLNEINSTLDGIKSKIDKEPLSTIFSLTPTIMVFEDTYDILYLEYSSIIKNKDQIASNIMLKETQSKLSSLLSSVIDFKKELPTLIKELNSLATTSNSPNKNQTNNNTSNKETNKKDTTTNVILYFGDHGQELAFDEETELFYEVDPNNPDDVIEYKGKVHEITLDEYLDTEVFFDSNGNELLFDNEADSYFILNPETGEFDPYDGEVVKMKRKDVLEKSSNNKK